MLESVTCDIHPGRFRKMAGRSKRVQREDIIFKATQPLLRNYMGKAAMFVTIIRVFFCLLSLVGLLDVDKNKVWFEDLDLVMCMLIFVAKVESSMKLGLIVMPWLVKARYKHGRRW